MVTKDDTDALQPVAARGSECRRSCLDFINMHDGAIEIKSPIVGHFYCSYRIPFILRITTHGYCVCLLSSPCRTKVTILSTNQRTA